MLEQYKFKHLRYSSSTNTFPLVYMTPHTSTDIKEKPYTRKGNAFVWLSHLLWTAASLIHTKKQHLFLWTCHTHHWMMKSQCNQAKGTKLYKQRSESPHSDYVWNLFLQASLLKNECITFQACLSHIILMRINLKTANAKAFLSICSM